MADPDDVDPNDLTPDPPPARTRSNNDSGNGWFARIVRALATGLMLLVLAGLGYLGWQSWPWFPASDEPEKVADDEDEDTDEKVADDEDEDKGPVAVSCDTSRPGVRWDPLDDDESDGRTLRVWHNGSSWDVFGVYCRGGRAHFENKKGHVEPVLTDCLATANGPRPGHHEVRIPETAACPRVVCHAYADDDCLPVKDVVPPPEKPERLSEEKILKGIDKILDRQDSFDGRLDELESRLEKLESPEGS